MICFGYVWFDMMCQCLTRSFSVTEMVLQPHFLSYLPFILSVLVVFFFRYSKAIARSWSSLRFCSAGLQYVLVCLVEIPMFEMLCGFGRCECCIQM